VERDRAAGADDELVATRVHFPGVPWTIEGEGADEEPRTRVVGGVALEPPRRAVEARHRFGGGAAEVDGRGGERSGSSIRADDGTAGPGTGADGSRARR